MFGRVEEVLGLEDQLGVPNDIFYLFFVNTCKQNRLYL